MYKCKLTYVKIVQTSKGKVSFNRKQMELGMAKKGGKQVVYVQPEVYEPYEGS